MRSIVLRGWNVGFKKVEHTKILKSRFGWSLSQAKAATDAVVAGKVVRLEVADDQYAEMVAELTALGAKVVEA